VKALINFSSMLNEAKIFTPYGATEAMPVTLIESNQLFNETQEKTEKGYGICVGKPVHEIEVVIISITDNEILNWSEDLKVAQGVIGEIVVKGKNVTGSYYNQQNAIKLAKIKDGDSFRHRMGDVGYFDAEGNVWFCGRKAHRVKTGEEELYSIQCEYIFNKHPDVFRTALVAVNDKAVLCVETEKNKKHINKPTLKKDLLKIAAAHDLTLNINTILFHPEFPVDIRHNAKIIREKLAVWAKNKLS
jgi:acyl-CoA synthetase (AMP-forming)/AMP-acid ligase II